MKQVRGISEFHIYIEHLYGLRELLKEKVVKRERMCVKSLYLI